MKKFLFVFVIAVIAIGAIAVYLLKSSEKKVSGPSEYFLAGEEFYEEYEYSKAIEQYKLAINSDPAFTDAYIKAAEIYLLKSKDEDAVSILENGIGSALEVDKIYYFLGKIYFDNKTFEKALEYFESSRDKNADNIDNAVYLAKSYGYVSSKIDKDESVIEQVNAGDDETEVKKNFYLALLNTDDVVSSKGLLEQIRAKSNSTDMADEVNDLYSTFEEISSDSSKDVYNKTLWAYELIKYEFFPQAIVLLDEATTANDEYAAAFMYKGLSYLGMNELDKALENLQKATVIDEYDTESIVLLAHTYELKKDQKSAIDTFQIALSMNSEDEVLRYEYIKLLLGFELYSQTEAEYNQLIGLANDNLIQYKIELAEIFLNHLKKYEEGLNLALEAVNDESLDNSLNEIKSQVYDSLGWANHLNDKQTEAMKYIDMAIEISPNLSSAYYHKGMVYKTLESASDAISAFEKAIDLDLYGEVGAKASLEIESFNENDEVENQ